MLRRGWLGANIPVGVQTLVQVTLPPDRCSCSRLAFLVAAICDTIQVRDTARLSTDGLTWSCISETSEASESRRSDSSGSVAFSLESGVSLPEHSEGSNGQLGEHKANTEHTRAQRLCTCFANGVPGGLQKLIKRK